MSNMKSYEELIAEIGIDLWSEAESISEIFRYQGFDPKQMANLIRNKAGNNLKTDLPCLIILALERGSAIEKIMNKSSEKGKELIKTLKDRYGITQKAGTNPNAVTLPRICLAFPWAACGYLNKNNSAVSIVPIGDLTPQYPAVMRTAAFASMIPSIERDRICAAFCLYQYHFSRIISPKTDTKASRLEKVRIYCLAGVNNNYVPEPHRIRNMLAWGILVKRGVDYTISKPVEDAVEAWTQLNG